jgi:hypothetical protein
MPVDKAIFERRVKIMRTEQEMINLILSIARAEERIRLFTSTNRSNELMRKLLGKAGFTFCGEIDALDEGDPELFFFRKKVAK